MAATIEMFRGIMPVEEKNILDKVINPPSFTDSSGTPGNATANTALGRSAIAASATACVVTNNLVSSASVVQVSLETADATATRVIVVPANGSFTVTANAAATGTTKFNWLVAGTRG